MTTSDWLQYPELNCTVATVTETAETCVPTFTRVNSVQIARYISTTECLRLDFRTTARHLSIIFKEGCFMLSESINIFE